MTGTITTLAAGSGSGWIKGEDGRVLPFEVSAVFAYDAGGLAVGQMVTFDLEDGKPPQAVNVCVQKRRLAAAAADKMRFRYVGFEQQGGIRAYHFDRISPGEGTKTFIVTADMLLFLNHRVHIQEGPAMCLHLLLSHAEDGTCADLRVLNDEDMLAHLASRPVPPVRSGLKRQPRAEPAAF